MDESGYGPLNVSAFAYVPLSNETSQGSAGDAIDLGELDRTQLAKVGLSFTRLTDTRWQVVAYVKRRGEQVIKYDTGSSSVTPTEGYGDGGNGVYL